MRCYHYFFKRIRKNLIPFQNMSAKNSVKINVIKGSFIKKVTTVSLLAISLTLTIVQTPLTPAVAAICSGPAAYPPDLPDCLDPVVAEQPVATAAAPSAKPMTSPIALPPVTAPVQVVVVKPDEKPAAPAVPVAANGNVSQVSVDGKFVNIQIAPRKDPEPGTVGVAVVGDNFKFSVIPQKLAISPYPLFSTMANSLAARKVKKCFY